MPLRYPAGIFSSFVWGVRSYSSATNIVSYPFSAPPNAQLPVPIRGKTVPKWVSLIRNDNSAILVSQRQVLVGTIMHVDIKHVLVDLGWKQMQCILKHELNTMEMVGFHDSGQRKHAQDFRRGDKFKFYIDSIQSPFGFAHVYPLKSDAVVNLEMVWDELKKVKSKDQTVMGRVLNAVNGGYAVGVGGIVGFCAYKNISKATINKIGIRHQFKIERLNPDKKQLSLVDVLMFKKQ